MESWEVSVGALILFAISSWLVLSSASNAFIITAGGRESASDTPATGIRRVGIVIAAVYSVLGVTVWVRVENSLSRLLAPLFDGFPFLGFELIPGVQEWQIPEVLFAILCIAFIFVWLVLGTIIAALFMLSFSIRHSSSGLHRMLAMVTAVALSIGVLSILNIVLNWKWNFPDVFGLVSGLVALGFSLYDRYVVSKTKEQGSAESIDTIIQSDQVN